MGHRPQTSLSLINMLFGFGVYGIASAFWIGILSALATSGCGVSCFYK